MMEKENVKLILCVNVVLFVISIFTLICFLNRFEAFLGVRGMRVYFYGFPIYAILLFLLLLPITLTGANFVRICNLALTCQEDSTDDFKNTTNDEMELELTYILRFLKVALWSYLPILLLIVIYLLTYILDNVMYRTHLPA